MLANKIHLQLRLTQIIYLIQNNIQQSYYQVEKDYGKQIKKLQEVKTKIKNLKRFNNFVTFVTFFNLPQTKNRQKF